jgi:hypothetical protein
MKIVYYFSSNEPFEYEAMFDEGAIIDVWQGNDASWRNGRYSGLMDYLDVKVKPLPKKYHKDAIKQIHMWLWLWHEQGFSGELFAKKRKRK